MVHDPRVLDQISKCLKAKKIHGFKSCIVISVYPLDIPSIKKATEYLIIDKLTS